MIISHKHKFIFIKTEKTAGTSLEIALSKFCGPEDIITPITQEDEITRKELGYPGPINYKIPFSRFRKDDWCRMIIERRRPCFYNHMPAREIRRYIGNNIWKSYFKFCFERNPYDKVVSWYHWAGKGSRSIRDFILSGGAGRVRGFDLYAINGIPVVDKVYKFEELNDALIDIGQKVRLGEAIHLPIKRAKGSYRSDRRHYREVLGDEEKDLVTRIFARELRYFDYEY